MNLVGNKVTINFKPLICLKITLVKFANPKGWTGLGDYLSVPLFSLENTQFHIQMPVIQPSHKL